MHNQERDKTKKKTEKTKKYKKQGSTIQTSQIEASRVSYLSINNLPGSGEN